MKTIQGMERHIAGLAKERQQKIDAINEAIETEQAKDVWDKARQARTVQDLKGKRDSIIQAYDSLQKKANEEMETIRAETAKIEARQNAELEKRAAGIKQEIYRAYIAAGGLPADFDEHYQAVITARTVKNMEVKRVSPVTF